ncbi:MAG: DUF3108 domain-containing protein [Deltaproteobacteria bacterium]|nr:DUF3108 domain-containing protein [Deltaproteobacteria bacterium]
MTTNRTLKAPPFLLALVLAWVVAVSPFSPAAAQSAAELLEQGIYTEQTVGDLNAAIEIYSRIVENDEANRAHVAQAQLRLGMCLLKKGSAAESRVAFDKLIRQFPDQEELVIQAREGLAAAQPGLPLRPAPWRDGELLVYRMSLPTGKEIGKLYLSAESKVVDGTDAWLLEMRRFVFNAADNYGVNRMLVEAATQRPISTVFRHGVLGNAEATYGPERVVITGAATEARMESPPNLFDNDQGMHLMRMLPLEVGYEVKLNFLPAWTAQIVEVGLKVKKADTCQVPAGDFECLQVNLDLGQSTQRIWFSTDSDHYPVKMKAEGIVIELAEILQTQPGTAVPFGLDDFGFSGTLPNGWLGHDLRPPGRADRALVRLLDPLAEAISGVELNRCPRRGCPSLKENAEGELAGAKKRFQDYQLREGSLTARTIDGRQGISFVGDYQRNGAAWVQYRFYTFVEEVRLEFIFRTPAENFSKLLPVFDGIIESIRAE